MISDPGQSCHGHNIILCISEATPKSGASPKKKVKEAAVTPSRPISHPRFKPGGEQHNVRILEQPTSSMHLDLQKKEESKAASANSGMKCSLCDFTATRINVLIMHTKTHRYTYIDPIDFRQVLKKSLIKEPPKRVPKWVPKSATFANSQRPVSMSSLCTPKPIGGVHKLRLQDEVGGRP